MKRRSSKDDRWVGAAAAAAALILVFLCLTGCGGTTTTSPPTTAASDGTSGPTIPTTSTSPPNGAPDLDLLSQRAFALLDSFVAGDYDTIFRSFDQTMKNSLPPEKLAQVWEKQVIAQVGPYKGNTGARQESAEGYEAVIIQAQFEKAALDVRWVFDAHGLVAGLFFQPAQTAYTSPAYVKPDSFTSQEVTVRNGAWVLPGTLTLPRDASEPVPGLVLVHGSGPNDRDETLGPNKPFRDLAEGLASIGVAVLRYDKRSFVYPKETAGDAGITLNEETVDDAAAAFHFLRTIPEIDPARVFILGHSLGGYAIPRIGLLTPEAAGFILMAAAARPLEDLILEQLEYIYSLSPQPSEEETAGLAAVRDQVHLVKSPSLTPSTPASKLPLGIPASYWLDLRDYSPASTVAELGQPVLVIQGGRDYQVTEADFRLWEAALVVVPGSEFRLYPDLNHLFVQGKGMATPGEYLQSGHVAAEVITDIAQWMASIVVAPRDSH